MNTQTDQNSSDVWICQIHLFYKQLCDIFHNLINVTNFWRIILTILLHILNELINDEFDSICVLTQKDITYLQAYHLHCLLDLEMPDWVNRQMLTLLAGQVPEEKYHTHHSFPFSYSYHHLCNCVRGEKLS